MVDLGLDLVPFALGQGDHVDFIVKVADVADDSFVFHRIHMLVGDHVFVAGSGHKNVSLVSGVIHGDDFVAFHGGLQRVDRVNLGHPDLGRKRAQRLCRTLTHVTVTSDHADLAGNHHVGGALDRVNQRFAAAVQVVELALGHRIIDVDSAEFQLTACRHFVEAQHAGGGFFSDTDDVFQAAAVPGRIDLELGLDGVE